MLFRTVVIWCWLAACLAGPRQLPPRCSSLVFGKVRCGLAARQPAFARRAQATKEHRHLEPALTRRAKIRRVYSARTSWAIDANLAAHRCDLYRCVIADVLVKWRRCR